MIWNKCSSNEHLVTLSPYYFSELGSIDRFYNFQNSSQSCSIIGKRMGVKTPLTKNNMVCLNTHRYKGILFNPWDNN